MAIRAEHLAPGCLLCVLGEGSNLDSSIRPMFRHFLKEVGLTIARESDD